MPRITEPFSIIPLSLWELPPTVVRVYAALDEKCGKRGWWYGPRRALCAATGLGERTIERAVQQLREGGYIDTDRIQTPEGLVSRYMVVARSVPPPPLDARQDPFEDADPADPADPSTLSPVDSDPPVGGLGPACTDVASAGPRGYVPPVEAVPTLPHNQSSPPHTRARADAVEVDLSPVDSTPRTARQWFRATFGYEPNRIVGQELDEMIDHTHPAECVAWTFREVAARETPNQQPDYRLARAIFGRCIFEGHGPREKRHATPGRTSQAAAGRRNGHDPAPTSGRRW